MRFAGSFAFERRGELAYFAKTADTETEEPAQEPTTGESNAAFHRLFNEISLTLAYAYHTPGTADRANPYYQNSNVLQLYLSVLDYAYSRGLTENAWLPDHAGNASVEALEQGLVRTSGDFSEVSLRLAGYIQSVFLMRNELAGANLLAKYRAVVRNLVVNCGVMYGAFFQTARAEAGVSHADPFPIERQYLLNADGMRLFVDYFWPYYMLVDDVDERSMMAVILYRVIDTNIATRPGVYGTIKPDGTGFHHGAAYVGAYSPFALEAFAQLLYLSKGTTFYRTENIDAVKLALDAYRVMVQKYSVTAALRGRLIRGSGDGVSNAVSKAMAFLAHPDGLDDFDMKARFAEFFDEEHFLSDERQRPYFEGSRGLAIRGLGIYRLISALQASSIEPSDPPSGTWIKPYAAAGFFRRGDWLVAAKGFSQYFWDYEGDLDGGENSFGQNWAYGSLMVFSAGAPISERGSGYALFDGWDWYHVPGTTASHYTINAQQLTGLDQLVEHEAGTSVKMTDSVGNSFFLESSTAKLVVSRTLQQSMSDDYESTEGAFASAYLDHGIKPEQDSYRYVLIPADTDGSKLEQVAADTSAYYEVLDDTNMHLVRFPPQDITAYAFFKPVETPEDELIRTVNQPAAVMIHEQEEEGESDGEVEGEQEQQAEETSVRLVASVPDIGWQFESDIFSRGLSYASSHFAMQRAKEHKLRLVLRGEWCPDELTAPSGAEWISLFGHTLLQLQCKDGLGTEILLRPCAAAADDSDTDAEGGSGTSSADSNPEDAPETVAPSPVDGSVSMAPIASSE